MGLPILKEQFDDADYAAYADKLQDDLRALEHVIARPGFGEGPMSIGAELELDLVGADAAPLPVNRMVLAEASDPRFCVEVDRFNIEINAPWSFLAGRPFRALEGELHSALGALRRAASVHGARPVSIGILPTLDAPHLTPTALTDDRRFHALSARLRGLRGQPFAVRIEGDDVLEAAPLDVTYEGANTSFQLHLRTTPEAYARTYNAAQLAIAPALAVSTNSPLFFGRRLWDETRIALFRQAVDDRHDVVAGDRRPARVSFGHGWVQQGAYELFAEAVREHAPLLPVVGPEQPLDEVAAGRVPQLAELRLHHGTVWRWTRAVYDPCGEGHLRVELRALPSGPTVTDMVANGAFLLGVTLALAPQAERLVRQLSFDQARHNFYEAARRGPDATLLWPDATGRVVPHAAMDLVRALLPQARAALLAAGVAEDDVTPRLAIVEARANSRMTGSRWLRRELASMNGADSWQASAAELLERYLRHSDEGNPVHTWS